MFETPNYTSEDLKNHYGIAAVIKDNDGKILLQEHVKYGFWTLPSGKVLPTQTIEEGLKQEIFEECGIQIQAYKELIQKDFVYNRKGITVVVKSHIFEITEYTGEIENKEPNKHKQQKFFTVDEILGLPYLSDLSLLRLQHLGLYRLPKI